MSRWKKGLLIVAAVYLIGYTCGALMVWILTNYQITPR